jgi:hypothetical protein
MLKRLAGLARNERLDRGHQRTITPEGIGVFDVRQKVILK